MIAHQMENISDKVFEHIVENSSEIMIISDDRGLIRYANRASSKIYGVTAGQVLNQPLNIIFTSRDSKKNSLPSLVGTPLLSHMAQSDDKLNMTVHTNSGDVLASEMRVSNISWQGEHCFLVVLHDINSIKKIAELESKIREQKRVDKLKDELISVVSHELRTPLTVIKGSINNLLDGITGILNDKQRTVLSTTKRNADRLSRLIDDLLDLSRLESGHVKVNRKQITPASLIQDIVQNFHPQAEQGKITIETNIPEVIAQINADHDMICQVLSNLVTNTLRYAKSKVTLSTKQLPSDNGTEFVQFTISDDGIGIDPQYHDRLFNKFEQINRPQGGSGYKGTGLGLAICKEIISLHNGKIWIESEPGKGTNFCFTIPVYQEKEEILDELKRLIEQSKKYQKPLAFMTMAITNLNTISKHCTEKDIEWMLNDISKEIHGKALRKSDVIKYQKDSKEFFIILNDTNTVEAKTISKRIHNITKDCFCPGNTGKIFADLNIGIAMYPDDEKDADKLMALSLKEIR